MPARLFGEWCAFMFLEPGGEVRMDLRFALLCMMQCSEKTEPGDWFETLRPRLSRKKRRELKAQKLRMEICSVGEPAPPGEYFPPYD